MGTRFQAASLASSPSYPNSIAWSQENLIAVAAGHLVTILNPASPTGPRGLIVIPPSDPFPIGVIKREDLSSGCLLPTTLSRDCKPCVRSISWSPLGLAPNSGCLLAVCTTEGRVKLYRPPFCEFSSEWVELLDLSDMLFEYFKDANFLELNNLSTYSNEEAAELSTESGCQDDLLISFLKKKQKRKQANDSNRINKGFGTSEHHLLRHRNREITTVGSTPHTEKPSPAIIEKATFLSSIIKESSPVEVLRMDGYHRIWVAGILDSFSGVKALVTFIKAHGEQNERVEVDLEWKEETSAATWSNSFPKLRPSMNVGNFPEEISHFEGVDDILSIGQVVEAWTNDRWVEGFFMGFDKGQLMVKFHGDHGSAVLAPSSVRLAPVWISDKKSWQVTVVKMVVETSFGKTNDSNSLQIVRVPSCRVKPQKMSAENCTSSHITASEYASRRALLASLVIAWSPMLQLSKENNPVDPSLSPECSSLLAIGGKSGRISFWKISSPCCYTVEQSGTKNAAVLVGLLQAHAAWITSIDWVSLDLGASNPQFILATGSSNGSVKLWLGSCEELLKSSEVKYASFLLLNEVSSVGSVPVSVLSLSIPVQCQDKSILAIGRASGSIEVWMCNLPLSRFVNLGSYAAHDHVVMGLAWAFNGNCLYSCSQDNSVHSWMLDGNSLSEEPILSSKLGVKSSVDVPNVSDSCFGISVSPGNLVLVAAHSLDVELLNPMYQARTMKATVDFFWIGGQLSHNVLNKNPEINIEAFPGFSEKELVYWESNILWSLNQYEHEDRPLVIWDITAALLGFKQSASKYFEHILFKWISRLFGGFHLGLSIVDALRQASRLASRITSRRLQLLNTICRRVVLVEFEADQMHRQEQELVKSYASEDEQMTLWMNLLLCCERELRERLVGFSFSAALKNVSCLAPTISRIVDWHPVGLAQMDQWIGLNDFNEHDKLRSLATEVGKLARRLGLVCGYVAEEKCSFCSASVPFESPEVGFCQGASGQRHRLTRCAVSMRVCPMSPLWFCMCCQRRASELAPEALFTMPERPSDFKSYVVHSTSKASLKPLCPFCGILLQRLQPDFLLTVTPV